MDVTFEDKLGSDDREIIKIAIVDGELEFTMDKPESLGWQELIYFIKYVIAEALSQETELSVSDIFQWLGSLGLVAEEVAKTGEEIIEEARRERMRQLMLDEKLKLDQVDR